MIKRETKYLSKKKYVRIIEIQIRDFNLILKLEISVKCFNNNFIYCFFNISMNVRMFVLLYFVDG